MKRVCVFVAVLMVLSVAVPTAQAQWIITTPINLLSTTVPVDTTWIIANGGSITMDPGQTLSIYGTVIVQPGGMVILDDYSNWDVYGRMRFDDFDPLVGGASMAIEDGAVMRILPGGYVAMGVDSKIGFVGAGIIKIAPGGYIEMNNGHIANNASNTGLIDCYETWPFRNGPGWFYDINMFIHNNFDIRAGDLMYFIDGGKIRFDCLAAGAPFNFNIEGIAKFGSNYETFTFADCLGMIYVGTSGILAVGSTIMDSVSNVAGDIGSVMDLCGATWRMRFHAAIKSQGAVYYNSSTFECTNGRFWNGLVVDGSLALLQVTDCLFTDIDLSRNGIGLSSATNAANVISRTTIQCPPGPLGATGNGIKMGGLVTSRSYLKLVCSDINGFNTGIGMTNADIAMDGADIYINNTGMNLMNSTAYIRNSFIRNNYANGVVVTSLSAYPPYFDMSKSSVTGNQGYQFSINATNNVFVDSCNIYYRTGNTTAPIVYASASTAQMQRNWWGINPTVPAQFVLVGGSVVNHFPDMAAPWIINRGCIYTKRGEQRSVTEVPAASEIAVRNYPNPFNPSTTIEYVLPEPSMVSVTVYNMLGVEIATIVNEPQSAGTHTATFNAEKALSSGVYLYEVRTQAGSAKGTMMLTK